MDKKIIKDFLVERFLNEAKPTTDTPGITVTNAIRTKSGKENKAGIKDMQDNLKDYDKSVKKQAEGTKEMPQNKFNYNDDNEQTYHQQMEDMNGQEMIEYDRDPNKMFKDRAKKAIEGDSTMGNNPEWANVVPKQQGFTGPDFGKNLVKAIKASHKKRQDAVKGVISFGDDFEVVPDDYAPMSSFSALNENKDKKDDPDDMEQADASGDAYEKTNREISTENKVDTKNKFDVKRGGKTIATGVQFLPNGKDYKVPTKTKGGVNIQTLDKNDQVVNHNDNNTKQTQKESMKRLKFKQEFNGVGNALKMIPESYRVDNKVFEMTDGNESYTMRWEGTLSEGRAVVLTASDKTMINEDMQKMKHLMGYKSQDTLGLVKGKSRIEENATFGKIWDKTKILMEAEDIEGKKASEKKTDEKVSQAADAKKHVEGSVSTDKGTKAPAAKTGSADSLEKVKKQAPEAKKNVHVGTTGDSKIGMGLGDQSEGEGEWDQMDVKQAAAHGNPSNTTYAPAPKTGEWDKVSVPQAADAKKHVSMNEGVKLNGIDFAPMNVDELFK
jgi:hypothetical protein